MKRLGISVVSLFLLGSGVWAQESIPTLDLSEPVRCKDTLPDSLSGTVSGPGGLTHAPPPPRLPLDLRLVAIEPLPLREGSKVTYEVELENVGDAPFLIPWGEKCYVPRYDDPSKLTAGVSLILDEYSESPKLARDWARGATNEPRTTRSLAPGEKARIRLSGTPNYSNYPDELKRRLEYQEEAMIDVRAELLLRGKPYRKYGYVRRKSSNVVAVEIALVQDERQAP